MNHFAKQLETWFPERVRSKLKSVRLLAASDSYNNRCQKLALLVVPVLYALYCIRFGAAESVRQVFADPDWYYLMNFIQIASFEIPGNIRHPGIPIQIVGGWLMYLQHFFSFTDKPLVEHVLENPNWYLHVGGCFASIFNALSVWLCSLVWLRLSRNLLLTLITQFFILGIPIFYFSAFLNRLMPEGVVPGIVAALATLPLDTRLAQRWYAPVIALALATKLYYLPFALGILLLKTRRVAIFITALTISLTSGLYLLYLDKQQIAYIWKVVTYFGDYNGSDNVTGSADLIINRILTHFYFHLDILVWLLVPILALLTIAWNHKKTAAATLPLVVCLLISTGTFVQYLYKPTHFYYLLPAFTFLPLFLFLLSVRTQMLPERFWSNVTSAAVLLIAVFSLLLLPDKHSRLHTARNLLITNTKKIEALHDRFARDCFVIEYGAVGTIPWALHVGHQITVGEKVTENGYHEKLQQLYPNHYFANLMHVQDFEGHVYNHKRFFRMFAGQLKSAECIWLTFMAPQTTNIHIQQMVNGVKPFVKVNQFRAYLLRPTRNELNRLLTQISRQ